MEILEQLPTAESIANTRTALIAQVAGYASEYLTGVDRRPVAPSAEAVAGLSALCGELPAGPTEAEAVVEMLHRYGSPATTVNSAGRYFGFVNGGMVPAALGAAMLVNAWDNNAGLRVLSPVAAELEATAIGWVAELLGLPAEVGRGGIGGAVVTGATMANFCALAAARHAILKRTGWDVEQDGLFGAPPITVVVGEEVHSSLVKALGMLGMGEVA